MVPLWVELRAAFDRSSDARKVVVGGLAGGAGGAVGALVGTDVYVSLGLTTAVTVVAVVCLLAAVAYLDRRAAASA